MTKHGLIALGVVVSSLLVVRPVDAQLLKHDFHSFEIVDVNGKTVGPALGRAFERASTNMPAPNSFSSSSVAASCGCRRSICTNP